MRRRAAETGDTWGDGPRRGVPCGAARAYDGLMPLHQRLRFCTSADGTRIALASMGSGPPLVRAGHWLSHLEFDAESPVWRPWLEELSRRHTYVRYDQRGCGLSDRDVPNQSLDAWVSDLEAVVAALDLKRFVLFGLSQGGAVALAYAARHPERVSRLVLMGAYARGARQRAATPEERLEAETLVNLIRVGWGRDNAAFRQLFTNQYIPEGTAAQHQWWNDLERLSASPEGAARLLDAVHRIDVTELAGTVRVPTLVLHARRDARIPFEEGRQLAALIPDARFVPLDSANHVLLQGEPAWQTFTDTVREFVSEPGTGASAESEADLTPAEREVLRLLAQGLDNHAIARQLRKSEKTVRNQVSSIFDKLGVTTRAQAIVRVRDRASST